MTAGAPSALTAATDLSPRGVLPKRSDMWSSQGAISVLSVTETVMRGRLSQPVDSR